MGRWADKKNNDAKVADALVEMGKNPEKGLKQLTKLADEAAKHDRKDGKVMRELVENHRNLAG